MKVYLFFVEGVEEMDGVGLFWSGSFEGPRVSSLFGVGTVGASILCTLVTRARW